MTGVGFEPSFAVYKKGNKGGHYGNYQRDCCGGLVSSLFLVCDVYWNYESASRYTKSS